MKIQKQSKKIGLPHPEVAALIATLVGTPQAELAGYLSSIRMWTWPRSDLNSWTKVLNQFDTILSDIIDKYDLNKLQLVKFEESDRNVLLEILRFERMLLENSTNRKLFASYDRLNALLATSDLDVLVAVLNLLLRPSQQYSSQPPTSHSLNISAPRLQALALRWPGLREANVELHDLLDSTAVVAKPKAPETGIRFGFGMGPSTPATGASTPLAGSSQSPQDVIPGSDEVTFQFYRKSNSVSQGQEVKPEATSDVTQSPARPSTSRSAPSTPSKDSVSQTGGRQSGMTVVRLTDLHDTSKEVNQIVAEAVEKYQVPEEEVFELMCRVRIARVLGSGQEKEREKVACARLLAIAIYAHTQSESSAQQQLFLYEPDLTQHLAELIHHDRNVPASVQAAAIHALDGIARYRHRSTEVLTAVNANVSHGILMGALRKTIAEVGNPESNLSNEFPEALIGFVTYLASQAAGGTQVVGAGLVSQLILLIDNRLPERMPVVSKAMPLVDNLLYGFPTAFQLFINAHGVDAMVGRILYEVNTGIEEYGEVTEESKQAAASSSNTSLLPFVRSSLLKHIIRSMHRMMQSSGTAEGLRTLIDSSLVKSVKLIMENKTLFGPAIYSIAINIMAMFVHNEPTSLAILQEAHVPDIFYKAIESGIEPAIEVITSIPNAIGALCLNQSGQTQFNEHKSAMTTFFSIFTSESHIKILLEKDNANGIGGAVDELVRHHPSLKDIVLENTIGMLQRIEDLGNAFPIPKDQESSYRLVSTTPLPAKDAPATTSTWPSFAQESAVASGVATPAAVEIDEQEAVKAERGENVIASHIDIACRFLDGMFQHVPHCHDFALRSDGLDRLGRLLALPCLPFSYGASLAADSMVGLFRNMAEVAIESTLRSLLKYVRQSLDETKPYWEEPSDQSRLAQLMEKAVQGNIDEANADYRRLFTLHLRANLLADIYTNVGYSFARGGPSLVDSLLAPDAKGILEMLGALHRTFVWEHAVLKSALNAQGVVVQPQSGATSTSEELLSLNRPQGGTPYRELNVAETSTSEKGTSRPTKVVNEQNGRLMRHLAEMLPSALAPFFHALAKSLVPVRRAAGETHRKQGIEAAVILAEILKEHLLWRPSSDLYASYAHATVMLNLLQILVFDERQTSTMQVLLLVTFFRVDGQERIIDLVNNCLNEADRIFDTPESDQTADDKNELVYVIGCTKVALGLLQSIVSSAPLFNSSQISQLNPSDKKPTDEDYFEPHKFLVKARATFIPLATRLWNAPWLTKASSDLVKGVINIVLEIMKGDREEASAESSLSEYMRSRTLMHLPPPRGVSVDEHRLQTLMDMGFSREAASHALTIGNGSTSRATDYLLAHNVPTGSGDSTSAPEAAAGEASSSMQADDAAPSTTVDEPDSDAPQASTDKGKGKASDTEVVVRDWAKELQDARQALRPDIGPRLFALTDKDPQLVFDVRSAFVGQADSYQAGCLDVLFGNLQSLTPNDTSFKTRCRLLAIILNQTTASDYLPPSEIVRALLDHLLNTPGKLSDAPMDWLAPYLLVIEVLIAIIDEISPVTLPKDDEPIPCVALRPDSSLSTSRSVAFNLCLDLLSLSVRSPDDTLAVLRLLIVLTRDHTLAADFLTRGGLQRLLAIFNDTSKDVHGFQIHSIIILRHIVESPSVIKQIVVEEVKRALPSTRSRPTETSSFVGACRTTALRDPEEFVKTASDLCELTTGSRPGSGSYSIVLSSAAGAEQSNSSEGSSGKPTGSDFGERLVQYLVNELQRAGRVALDSLLEDAGSSVAKPPQETSVPVDEGGATASAQDPVAQSTEPAAEAPLSDYLYTCFLLHVLAELLLSYPSCKTAFIAAGKKKMSTPVREGSKSKGSVLSFLLSDLLSLGKIYGPMTEKGKRQATISKCVTDVVVSLCSSSSTAPQGSVDLKEAPADILNIRKAVLDVFAKSIKDASSITSIDVRYGRLIAYSELCSRLLAPSSPMAPKPTQDDTAAHLAKIMLEKNFVGILTTAVGELDLNYPNVKSLVSAILRPLECLSKVAIKMGRSDKGKTTRAADEESESSSRMSVDDEEEESEEEAPNDLYRNSALGMFSGEMEEPNYAQDEEMDDSEEEGEEVEMEFGGEDSGTDSSDQTSEDEDEINAEGELAIADGDGWEDEDEEMTDGEEDEDETVEESEDDAGLTWQENAAPPVVEPGQIEREIDDAAAVELQEVLEEGGDAESASDDEDDALEQVDALPVGEEDLALDWDGQHAHHDRNFFMSTDEGRRLLGELKRLRGVQRAETELITDDSDAIFARGRGIGGAAPVGVANHPLLDNPEAARSGTQHSSRSRRAARGGPPATRGAFSEMLQAIDNMIGGEGTQFMRQLLAQHPLPPVGTLDIAASTAAGATTITASLTQPSGRHSSRQERTSAETAEVPEFTPAATNIRWQDEVGITHLKFSAERVRRITDHLILALLPAYREKVRQEKEAEREREEKAARDKEQEEIERAAKAKEEAEKEQATAQEPAPQEAPATTTDESSERSEPEPQDDVAMEDSATPVPQPTQTEESPASRPSDAPQMDVDPQPSGSGSTAEAPAAVDMEAPVEPPPQAPRVIVHIHGNEVDITDTGIDPTFLEALPDDMREEVLNQHVREQRTAAAIQPRLNETQISADFLDALPADIRAEILMQESAEQARLERARARAAEPAAPAGPSDIDPASFLASLDPQLRQAVLMDQDDGFLQTLPSALLAEVSALRDAFTRPYGSHIPRSSSGNRHEQQSTIRKPVPPRDSIQLLDKNGISALIRLLFFPQFPRKNNLHKILINLCENSKTREEMFVLLLGILQDGTTDVAAVDQSFSQMSVAKVSTSPTKSIKSVGASQELSPLFAHLNGENIPNLVAQRCLDTLGLIVAANERSSLYFLTEHELPAGIKRSSSRKGKGKEKHAPQLHFPIVLLLGLLDRPNILNSAAMLDSITSLLASVTKPLASLKSPQPSQPTAPPAEGSTETSSADAPPASSTASPPENKPGGSASADTAIKEPADESPEAIVRANPPQIPHHNFRLIVNILTSGEVSGKTFSHTLTHIQHCSSLPDVRDVIVSELKSKAQEFGTILYSDLDDLARGLEKAAASENVRSPAITKFSSASSDQAKLLRILKTIDYMYTSKDGPEGEATVDEEKVTTIYEDFRFQGLWRRLGDCLAVVEQNPELEHIATVLLPLIEALMVVCKHVKPQAGGRAQRALMSPLSPSVPRVSMSELFVEFTDAHRKVLNLMVRNNPSLMGGSFSLLVQNPRVLDFDNKRNWFNQQLRRRARDQPHGTLQLNLRRPHVFEDSFQNLQRKTGDQIKYGKLSVRFYNEEGVDAGGVTREWFQILARQMFNPDYALFQPCAADKLTFQPNRASMVNPEHLSFFKFVGRVIGKAIYDGRLMDAHFARSLYRQILRKPVDYRDVEWVDPDYYKSLCWILENDPTMLEMTFTVEADEFGEHKVVPLKENGERIVVDQENKKEFVQLSAQYRLFTSIKDQIEALLAGFYDIIPKELISIFNEQEVELLISGTPDIDIDEWRAATDYNGYSPSDPAIVWWWRALKSFDREDRAKVLSFATGTSRVPLDGFGDLQGVQGTQRFSIHRAYGDSDRLPQAHTCFNQIDLPQYSSYEKLRTQLLLAINEGGEGFGFA